MKKVKKCLLTLAAVLALGMATPQSANAQVHRVFQPIDQDFYMQAVYDEFGEYLLKTKNGLLHEVLLILKEKNERILNRISAEGSGDSAERKGFFEREKKLIRVALSFYDI